MRDMAAGPRVLLKRLRELMAEPLEPQERLDRIVRDIAQNMVAEVCSLYVLRADSVLELYATEGLNPGSRPPGAAAARPGPRRHHRRERPARSTCPTRSSIRPSPTCRRPARRSTTPSSACRCCGPGARSACWSCRTAPSAHYRDDEVEALETTAMVLAEMIATGDLARLTRPGLELDLRRPVSFTGLVLQRRRRARPCRAARAAHRRHQPVQRGHRRGDCGGWSRRSARCGSRSTTCCRAATSPSRASIARCSKPTACSPTTAAGCAGWRRRSATA